MIYDMIILGLNKKAIAYFGYGSVKNTFLNLSISALFSSSRFLVHVPLNANELCWPHPSPPWGDKQYGLL